MYIRLYIEVKQERELNLLIMKHSVDLIEKTKRNPLGETLDHFIGGDIVNSIDFDYEKEARKYAKEESKKDEWWETVYCWYDDEWDLIGKDHYKNGKIVHSIRE